MPDVCRTWRGGDDPGGLAVLQLQESRLELGRVRCHGRLLNHTRHKGGVANDEAVADRCTRWWCLAGCEVLEELRAPNETLPAAVCGRCSPAARSAPASDPDLNSCPSADPRSDHCPRTCHDGREHAIRDCWFPMRLHPWGLGSGLNQWTKHLIKADVCGLRACSNSTRLREVLNGVLRCPGTRLPTDSICPSVGSARWDTRQGAEWNIKEDLQKIGLNSSESSLKLRARYHIKMWNVTTPVKDCHSWVLSQAPHEIRSAMYNGSYVAIGIRWGDKLNREAIKVPLSKYIDAARRHFPSIAPVVLLKTYALVEVLRDWDLYICHSKSLVPVSPEPADNCGCAELGTAGWWRCTTGVSPGSGGEPVVVHLPPVTDECVGKDIAEACDIQLLAGGRAAVWTWSSNIYRIATYLRYFDYLRGTFAITPMDKWELSPYDDYTPARRRRPPT